MAGPSAMAMVPIDTTHPGVATSLNASIQLPLLRFVIIAYASQPHRVRREVRFTRDVDIAVAVRDDAEAVRPVRGVPLPPLYEADDAPYPVLHGRERDGASCEALARPLDRARLPPRGLVGVRARRPRDRRHTRLPRVLLESVSHAGGQPAHQGTAEGRARAAVGRPRSDAAHPGMHGDQRLRAPLRRRSEAKRRHRRRALAGPLAG